ncbi:MAG: hypothetical protein P8Z40_01950 [Chloroflexota bacterium]
MNTFVNALAENMANVLTLAAVVGLIAGGVLFWRARKRRVARFRDQVNAVVPIGNELRERLAQALNSNVAEMASIGAVTFLDLVWHYSMADPQIWDHFQGVPGDHIADALANLDVLKASMGDQAIPIVGHVVDYFQGLEATQVFHDLMDQLSHIGSASDSATVVLGGHGESLVDALGGHAASTGTSLAAQTITEGTLLRYVPLVTIGFASYRAWRRSQGGATLGRNVEFAAIEVATRAGGGLIGGQLGGVIGTFVAPGLGTILGGVAGAVAGAIGGAFLGEEVKGRHVHRSQQALDESLATLGATYLDDPKHYHQLTTVFVEHERGYVENLREMQRRLRRYALPWRRLWPDQKLIFLEETVARAQEGLNEVKLGTVDALDRLEYMRGQGQHRKMGIMLWSNPAMCQQLDCSDELIGRVEAANTRLTRELTQLGKIKTAPQAASA